LHIYLRRMAAGFFQKGSLTLTRTLRAR
jgi:hypothetical protein